jgi:hypothetical protein
MMPGAHRHALFAFMPVQGGSIGLALALQLYSW